MAWQEVGGANTGLGQNQTNANHWLGTRNAVPLIIRTENGLTATPNAAAEVMRFTPAAQGRRVGIGTTTPQAKLEVANQAGVPLPGIRGEGRDGSGVFGSSDSSFRYGVTGVGADYGVLGYGRGDRTPQASTGVYGLGHQHGVFSDVDSLDGIGVTGNGGLNGVGVYGNIGLLGSSVGVGVLGDGARDGTGVWGWARNGSGVHGESTAGTGVHGESTAPDFAHAGVHGESTRIGVLGESSLGAGVVGRTRGLLPTVLGVNTNGGAAVHGRSNVGGDRPAVFGENLGDGIGVSGTGSIGVSGNGEIGGTGVDGVSGTGDGVSGFSFTGVGVTGMSFGDGVAAVEGIAQRLSLGGDFSGSAGGVRGVWVDLTPGPHTGFGGDFSGPGFSLNPVPTGDRGGLRVIGHLFAIGGVKAAVVPHPDGSHRLLHSLECPQSWFEDFGRAEITEGRARVDLDPDFAAVVETEDYHVFLTPEGVSNGLYVSQREAEGFEVREQQGGTTGELTFSYRVVARRKDGNTERLARMEVPEEVPQPEERRRLKELEAEHHEEKRRQLQELARLAEGLEEVPEPEPPAEPTEEGREAERIEEQRRHRELLAERVEEQRLRLRELAQQVIEEEQSPPEDTPRR